MGPNTSTHRSNCENVDLNILVECKSYKALTYSENISLQGTLNPYVGQQYVPVYGVSTAANTANQPFSQLSPSISGGINSYPTMHGYSMPGNHFVHLTGSSFNISSPTHRPTIQAPFLVGKPSPDHIF
jgi:hypothetical protein